MDVRKNNKNIISGPFIQVMRADGSEILPTAPQKSRNCVSAYIEYPEGSMDAVMIYKPRSCGRELQVICQGTATSDDEPSTDPPLDDPPPPPGRK